MYCNISVLRFDLRKLLDKLPRAEHKTDVSLSNELQKLLNRAEQLAKEHDDTYITGEHIFTASLEIPEIKKLFSEQFISDDILYKYLLSPKTKQTAVSEQYEDTFDALNKYGKDITTLAEEGKIDPVIGRETEIRRAIQILSRRTKNNPVLVGDPGVGKTALIE